jgi:hypothetical protein
MTAREDFSLLTKTELERLSKQCERDQYDKDFTPEERYLWDDDSLPRRLIKKLVQFRQAIEIDPADALAKQDNDLEFATEDFSQLQAYLYRLRDFAFRQLQDIEDRMNDEECHEPEAESDLPLHVDQPEIVHDEDYLPHRNNRRRRNHASNHNTGAHGNYNRWNTDSQHGWGAESAAPFDWSATSQSGQGAVQEDGWGAESTAPFDWSGASQSGQGPVQPTDNSWRW